MLPSCSDFMLHLHMNVDNVNEGLYLGGLVTRRKFAFAYKQDCYRMWAPCVASETQFKMEVQAAVNRLEALVS